MNLPPLEIPHGTRASGVATRDWLHWALTCLAQEAARSADTHLLKLNFPAFPDIDFYFKDEAAHPSGSLKHRLARSLFLYALCSGRLRPGQPTTTNATCSLRSLLQHCEVTQRPRRSTGSCSWVGQ